jgi:hypothetical protein
MVNVPRQWQEPGRRPINSRGGCHKDSDGQAQPTHVDVLEIILKGGKMSATLSSKKKENILYLSRAAGFYQTELLSALRTMEDLLQIHPQPEWDVVSRLLEVESIFSDKDLYLSDLQFFLSGLHPIGKKRIFQLTLTAEVKTQLLEQLRKANWIHGELRRISRMIARATGADILVDNFDFCDLVGGPGDKYLVTMEEACSFCLREGSPDSTTVGNG